MVKTKCSSCGRSTGRPGRPPDEPARSASGGPHRPCRTKAVGRLRDPPQGIGSQGKKRLPWPGWLFSARSPWATHMWQSLTDRPAAGCPAAGHHHLPPHSNQAYPKLQRYRRSLPSHVWDSAALEPVECEKPQSQVLAYRKVPAHPRQLVPRTIAGAVFRKRAAEGGRDYPRLPTPCGGVCQWATPASTAVAIQSGAPKLICQPRNDCGNYSPAHAVIPAPTWGTVAAIHRPVASRPSPLSRRDLPR